MSVRADALLARAKALPQEKQDEIWKRLADERGKRDPVRFADASDGLMALALLEPKVLEAPTEWKSDDWKFVYGYVFADLVKRPEKDDACALYAGLLSRMPEMAGHDIESYLTEIEEVAGEPMAGALEAELANPKFPNRIAVFDFVAKFRPGVDPALSGVPTEVAALFAELDPILHESKQWKQDVIDKLRPRGTALLSALRKALELAPQRRTHDDNSKYWAKLACGLVLARIELDARLPLSPEGRAALVEDLNGWVENPEHDEDLLRALDEAERAALIREALAKEKQHGSRLSLMVAHLAPATLPDVLEALDPMVLGKYDDYRKRRAIQALVAFGKPAAAELARRLVERSTLAAEIVANALVDVATPEIAPQLVEMLGHSAKSVRLPAIAALTRLGPAAKEALEAGARSKKKAAREAAAEILAKLAPSSSAPSPVDALLERAEALDPAKKKALLDALAYDHKPANAAALLAEGDNGLLAMAVAKDWFKNGASDYKVRGEYMKLFGWEAKKAPEPACGLLARAIGELPKISPYWVREIIAHVRQVGEGAAPSLAALLKGPAFPLRPPFFELYLQLAREPDRAVVLAGLSDDSKEVRTLASEQVAKLGVAVAPQVVPLLASKAGDVRMTAATLLTTLATPEAQQALTAALAKEKKAEVAAAMERALRACGGASAAPAIDPAAGGEDGAVAALARERKAKLPKWLEPEKLPKLLFKSGKALEGEALAGFLSRLMNEGPDAEDATARAVRPLLDDASANAFSVAIKDLWAAGKADAKNKWAIYQQAVLVEEARLNEVGPRLEEMVSGGHHHLAGWYVDVMLRHGLASASAPSAGLSWVWHWARSAETRSLRENANAALATAAQKKGVTAAQLGAQVNLYIADDVADAAIPGFGMEKPIELEFGTRKFRVRVGGDLRLEVVDAEGKATRKLPAKVDPNDAPALAGAAQEHYKQLTKSFESAAEAQAQRLERAMVSGRRWTSPAFLKLFVQHPWMRHLGDKVLWCAAPGTGTGERALFRLAEGSAVACDYGAVALPEKAQVQVVHPMELSEKEAADWSKHFADAEIVQPFKQLGRPVREKKGELDVSGQVKPAVLAGRIRGLGWKFGAPQDAGNIFDSSRAFPGRGQRVCISHGCINVSDNSWNTDPIGVESVSFSDLAGNEVKVEAVDPIVFSEVAEDLRRLLAP